MERKQQPVPGTIIVKAACGHSIPFELGPPKYREERKRKVIDRKCPPCRAQDQKAFEERQQAEKAEREKNRPKGWRDRFASKPRLPHMSAYQATYNAEAGNWCGTLTILGAPSFTGSSSGIIPLLAKLDDMYREWLEQQKAGTQTN